MNPHCFTYVIYVRARIFNLEEPKLGSRASFGGGDSSP